LLPLSHSPKIGAIGGLVASLATSVPVSPEVPAQGSHEGRVFCPNVHKEYLGVGFLMRVRLGPNRHPERAGFGLYSVVGWGINNKNRASTCARIAAGSNATHGNWSESDLTLTKEGLSFRPSDTNSLQHYRLLVQRFSTAFLMSGGRILQFILIK
jgi:hypothetical protein